MCRGPNKVAVGVLSTESNAHKGGWLRVALHLLHNPPESSVAFTCGQKVDKEKSSMLCPGRCPHHHHQVSQEKAQRTSGEIRVSPFTVATVSSKPK